MYKDREIKTPRGEWVHLEKPRYGIMIKDRIVINQEQFDLFMARQAQNKVAPTSTPPDIAEQTRKAEAELKNNKVEELEKKVDGMADTLSAILNKLNEKS